MGVGVGLRGSGSDRDCEGNGNRDGSETVLRGTCENYFQFLSFPCVFLCRG